MEPDLARLRATVEHLASFDRPSASEGEQQAAEWIRDELEALGVPARIEVETAVGSMAIPLGLLSAVGRARGARPAGARRLLGLLAAAGIVDDVSGGPQLFRRLLPTARPSTSWAPPATRTPRRRSCSSPTTTPPTAA